MKAKRSSLLPGSVSQGVLIVAEKLIINANAVFLWVQQAAESAPTQIVDRMRGKCVAAMGGFLG